MPTLCPVTNATTEHQDTYLVCVCVCFCVCVRMRGGQCVDVSVTNARFFPSTRCRVSHFHWHRVCAVGSICGSEECCGITVPNTSSPKTCQPLQRGLGGAKDSFKVKPAPSGETEDKKWAFVFKVWNVDIFEVWCWTAGRNPPENHSGCHSRMRRLGKMPIRLHEVIKWYTKGCLEDCETRGRIGLSSAGAELEAAAQVATPSSHL